MIRLFEQVEDAELTKALEDLLIEMPSFISDMLANLYVMEKKDEGHDKEGHIAYITNKNQIIIHSNNVKKRAQITKVTNLNELFKVIFIHELLHYKLRHFERLKNVNNKTLTNICFDVEIHNLLYHLKQKYYKTISSFGGVTFESINRELKKDILTPDDTAEVVYEKLQNEIDNKGKGSGIEEKLRDAMNKGTIDNIEDILKDIPSDVLIKSASSNPGNVPKQILGKKGQQPGDKAMAMVRDIENRLQKVYVPNVKNLLKRLVESHGYTNRSYAYPNKIGMTNVSVLPGNYSTVPNGKILVGIDTSGSVGDEELEIVYSFINELYKLAKFEIKIVYCDTELYEGEVIKSKSDLKKKLNFKGFGGTELNPIIDYSNKGKYDFLFILTDGYIANTLKPSKAKRIVMLYNKTYSSTEHIKGERYYYLTDK